VLEVLREVVAALSQGLAITVEPHQMVLSTSEAAQMLRVSRPTLALQPGVARLLAGWGNSCCCGGVMMLVYLLSRFGG